MDYRLYDPDRDGKTKLQHLQEMLPNVYFVKNLPFRVVEDYIRREIEKPSIVVNFA